MAGLVEEWRSICRFLGGSTTSAGPDDANAAPPANFRTLMRELGATLRSWFRPASRPRVRAAEASSIPLWLEATREEPRANRRALGLLLKLLNPEQREEFRRSGHFHVIGGKSHAHYRIRPDRVANIDVLGDDGTVLYRLCVAPAGAVPVYDVMAAQMLHLQDAGAEERFLQMANVFYRMGSRPAWF